MVLYFWIKHKSYTRNLLAFSVKLGKKNYAHQGFGSTERPPTVEVIDMKFCVITSSSSCMVEGKCHDATCIMQTQVTCHSGSKALKEAFFRVRCVWVSNVKQKKKNVNRCQLLDFYRAFYLVLLHCGHRCQNIKREQRKIVKQERELQRDDIFLSQL